MTKNEKKEGIWLSSPFSFFGPHSPSHPLALLDWMVSGDGGLGKGLWGYGVLPLRRIDEIGCLGNEEELVGSGWG